MGMKVSVDFETRSPVDLKTHGAFVYFEHPQTTVLMAAYRIDDQPIRIWTYDQPRPEDLCAAIAAGATIHAWNAQFETLGFMLLADRQGWPRPRYDQFVDTAAAAAAMALPRKLGDAAAALDLDVQKDKEGQRLIRKFSIPRRARKDETPGLHWNEPADHPADFELFKSYCIRDVETEEAAAKRLVPLSDAEQHLWLLDQEINRRGIRIDRTSARAAIALADKSKRLLDREMRLVTGGFVGKCSEPGKLVEWVQAQGVTMNTAQKAEITDLLDRKDLPPAVHRAVELRQEAAKTSVSKLQAMLNRASDDGRVRGSFMYHAASTGRWQSSGVNFANMPRPRRCFDSAKVRLGPLFDAFRAEDPEWLKTLYGDELGRPLHLVSDAIRGFIWSAPGHDLVQADYSGIEGAVAAWLARERWKVEALHEILLDPSLPDMYRRTAAGIMNMSTDVIDKKHPLRQSVGKTSELALGFAGGVSAFYTMAKNYGVDLDPLYAPVWAAADEERRAKAMKRWEKCVKSGDSRSDVLSREAWIACEIIKHGWRETNPMIAAGWKACENAIREAIQNPERVVEALRCAYVVKMGFLWCRLPSGRCLAYGSPKLKDQVWARRLLEDGSWGESETMDRDVAERLSVKGLVKIEGETSPKATVLGVNSATKKWERFALYGGLAFQNMVQAIARDLLTNGMLRAEAKGYPVIAHVYDEMITEVPSGFGDLADFEREICILPEWAKGHGDDLDMPLSAGGWRGKRYRKD